MSFAKSALAVLLCWMVAFPAFAQTPEIPGNDHGFFSWLTNNYTPHPISKVSFEDSPRIDKLMRAQASSMDANKRKQLFDRVQEIAWENEPFIYLVHKDALSAVSPTLRGATPVVLRPQTYWQIERMSLGGAAK